MFTIIGGDGKEYGPVTVEQIRAWIGDGRANLDTQARRTGEDQWRRLGDYPEFAENDMSAPPPIADSVPTVATVPTEPVAESITDTKAYAAELFARSGKLNVFDCLDAAFNLWKKNFLPLVGVTLLILVIQMIIGMVPFLGSLAGLFLNGVFYGGLYYYYLGKKRGEPREIGDAFAGFSRAFGSLVVCSLLTTLLTIVVFLIFAGPVFIPVFQAAFSAAATGVQPEIPPPSPLGLAGMFVGCLIGLYVTVAWVFAFALAVDKRIGPWTAMELSRRVVSKQWFRVFFTLLLAIIVTMLGVFGLIIGIVFTLPLAFSAIICAYETLFNPPPKA